MQNRSLGWVKQLPDKRDFKLSRRDFMVLIPSHVDLRPGMPPIYNQGELGSCTAEASVSCFAYDQSKLNIWTPSVLFQYYSERVIDEDVETDGGSTLRTACQALNSVGVCHETLWPYDPTQFAVKPPDAAYQDAGLHKSILYQSLNQDLDTMRGCLASGFPFMLGVSVYSSFMCDGAASTGNIPMPNLSTESLEGGHAISIVKYDDDTQLFMFRNSWGTGWGNLGYGFLPYKYLTDPDLASDLWTIRSIT